LANPEMETEGAKMLRAMLDDNVDKPGILEYLAGQVYIAMRLEKRRQRKEEICVELGISR